jgi:Transcriptional regulator, AbiEi antitoxin N-terminal domain
MSSNFTRRKTLRHLIPEGAVTTRSWLIDNGFDRHAIDNLVKSQQLSPVAQGVYTRPEATPTWQGIVHFLQTDLGLNLTIGGLTALDLLGFSHYLSLASLKKIHLYGTDGLPP